MKKFLSLLFVLLMLTACSDNGSSSSSRLAKTILKEYPELNNSPQQYASAAKMAQSEARSWIGSVPPCLKEYDFLFSRCINAYGQTYAVFSSPIGCASHNGASLSLFVYILTPVDYQTALTLSNDNAGSILTRNTPLPHYKISGTMVNYDPSDLNNLCIDTDEINLGCLILGPSSITEL